MAKGIVASLAPKNKSMGSLIGYNAAVMATESTVSMRKLFASTRLALLMSCPPMLMLISGAPPMPISEATEPIKVTTGPHTPRPAKARSPVLGIFPMYIRSTMLYKTLTN